MQRAHTSPHGWLQPCGGGRWCRTAGPPTHTQCCSEVSPRRWQRCPQRFDRIVYMQTTGRGSPWRTVAARSLGCLWRCGWSDLALEFAKALWKPIHSWLCFEGFLIFLITSMCFYWVESTTCLSKFVPYTQPAFILAQLPKWFNARNARSPKALFLPSSRVCWLTWSDIRLAPIGI